ncbi:hypothetical protein BJ875DRAFT_547209 [Amylocarpus encephaloides]|uniref:Uncharacterized protein n=1 Tax=Amylocarpus encephaloides TaxID=45428 RepID=A0A9P7Y8M2_9HELO|nr:hypothetical protein BJ875DRAFT_547209 [Amylocarpus encephaloides]
MARGRRLVDAAGNGAGNGLFWYRSSDRGGCCVLQSADGVLDSSAARSAQKKATSRDSHWTTIVVWHCLTFSLGLAHSEAPKISMRGYSDSEEQILGKGSGQRGAVAETDVTRLGLDSIDIRQLGRGIGVWTESSPSRLPPNKNVVQPSSNPKDPSWSYQGGGRLCVALLKYHRQPSLVDRHSSRHARSLHLASCGGHGSVQSDSPRMVCLLAKCNGCPPWASKSPSK